MAPLRTAAAFAAVVLAAHVQATEVPLPPCLDPFQPFVYSGCFQETSNTQLLPYRSPSTPDNMTVEECVAECKGNGYRYAGLVYYGVCYCGQTVNGPQVDETQCNLPCKGNETETCGGNGIFSVYSDPTFLPVEDVTIEDYHALGCWTDDSSMGRALVYRQDQVASASLTTKSCLQACRDGGYPFAGTEFGGECYCGVVIGNDTYTAPAEDCSIPCNGDSTEICGGRGRLNLFVAHELQSLEPCGYEPPVSSSTTTASTSTTTPPPETSTTVTVTTTTKATTTTSSVCTTTTVIPPTCEYKCGKWCSSPLPDWDDVKTCKHAWSNCAVQVASCFKGAGWPDVLDCFDFGAWCGDVATYCDSNPRGGCFKGDFWGKKPPKPGHGNPPKTVTVTTACPTTTATKTTTTTKATTATTTPTQCPIPTPTNICIQPSSKLYNYGPGHPVGGIALPIVTCNDLAADWPAYPFKGYTDPDSRRCKKYPRNQCTNACADACREQYEDCVDVYAQGCKTKPTGWWVRGRGVAAEERGERGMDFSPVQRRTLLGWGDDYTGAVVKCRAQYADCLSENRGVTGAGKCPKFGGW
ncbi:WSC domain-containing protein [Dichotomopilus funicola]|uniref:WSC domain-containing protein n=1 Tax=Dichotomopilus funicola TaxID=1934379 RepID=A0AAN6V9G9_9PEZI|nr:WSC domain-containing protein [Dichotomopilus funicola]